MPVKKSTEKTAKNSVTQRAVSKVKSAPQKLMEHTLSAALNAVEKAAVQDVKRKAKRVERSAKKVAKAKQNVLEAKAAARKVQNVQSATDKKVQMPQSEVKPVKVKSKARTDLKAKLKNTIDTIEQLIKPEKELVFYYDRRQQVLLAIFYALIWLVVYGYGEMVAMCSPCCAEFIMLVLMITKVLIGAAFILTLIVVIFKPTLAVVNKDGIKIDHNEMLKWDDVETAEEKYTSYISRRPLIALHVTPQNLRKYRLTFMQVLCKENVFTPFSIPMYAMTPHDAEAIREVIKRHTRYEDNRN